MMDLEYYLYSGEVVYPFTYRHCWVVIAYVTNLASGFCLINYLITESLCFKKRMTVGNLERHTNDHSWIYNRIRIKNRKITFI